MEYFDMQEEKNKEKQEQEKFQELYKKQLRISRITLLATILPMGIVFIILSIIFLITFTEGDDIIGGYVFLGVGVFCSSIAIILYFAIPKQGNYERYKRRVQRFGGLNQFDLHISVKLLEDKVKHLEEDNQSLRKRIDELERKMNR